MRIDIRSCGFKLTDDFKVHVQRRLGFALDRFAERIGSVTVRVRDVNAGRGGDDKQCVVEVNVIPLGRVVIGEQSGDPYVAVNLASDRLAARLGRVLKKLNGGSAASIRHLKEPDAENAA